MSDFVWGLLGVHNFVAQISVEVAYFAYFVVCRIVETVDFDIVVAAARMLAVEEVGYDVELPPCVVQIVVEIPSMGYIAVKVLCWQMPFVAPSLPTG